MMYRYVHIRVLAGSKRLVGRRSTTESATTSEVATSVSGGGQLLKILYPACVSAADHVLPFHPSRNISLIGLIDSYPSLAFTSAYSLTMSPAATHPPPAAAASPPAAVFFNFSGIPSQYAVLPCVSTQAPSDFGCRAIIRFFMRRFIIRRMYVP